MKEDAVKNTITFLKRYWWLLLLAVIAGNVIAWEKNKNNTPHYEYSFKIRVRGQYYDNTKSLINRIADSSSWKTKNIFGLDEAHLSQIISIRSDSYRNEDIYILESVFSLRDTSGFESTLDSAKRYMEKDSYLHEKYFNRLNGMNQLLEQNDNLVQTMNTLKTDSAGKQGVCAPRAIFDLLYMRNEIMAYRENLIRDFEIIFPSTDEIRMVIPSSSRSHAVSTILFLIFGIFIAVIVDQFRDKLR